MTFLDHCKALIAIDSTPSNGNVEMAKYCANLCDAAGLAVTLQEAQFNNKPQFNLLARPRAHESTEEIVFQTHLDTVEPGPHGRWTKTDSNPFRATIESGLIYGLGSADVKLDFLCKLEAIKKLGAKRLILPFVLVGTYAEETGMVGAQKLIATKAFNAKKAIIGEPSELQIVYANNGYLVVKFLIPFSEEEKEFRLSHHKDDFPKSQEKIFHGKAAHSSTPHLGENAILKLTEYLSKLPQGVALIACGGGVSVNTVPAEAHVEIDSTRTFKNSVTDKLQKLVKEIQKLDREFLGYSNSEFHPPHPTSNIAMLRVTENHLVVDVSFRITPNIEDGLLQTWIERLRKAAVDSESEFELVRLSPPARTSVDSDLIRGACEIARSLNLSDKPITKASGTESSVYSKHGIECFVFGPGKSLGNSHTANEHNILEQMEKATEFYHQLLLRFCL